MADAEWIENLRKIILQAVEAGRPCDIVLGTVVRAAPLEIQLELKTILTANQLLLPRSMTNYNQEMSIPGVGAVNATVKNSLKAGEQVLLIQKRGGQKYLVLDRWQKGG